MSSIEDDFYVYKQIDEKTWVKIILRGNKIITEKVDISVIPQDIAFPRKQSSGFETLKEFERKRKQESLKRLKEWIAKKEAENER